MDIRLLKKEEIQVRVGSISDKGYSALLYKDARVDMAILDEVYGTTGWMRRHEVINDNLFCTISIWDDEKRMWIDKQDVGVPSNAEAEKGEASDAFKRAGYNVGIGRELYTAPFIWIVPYEGEITTGKNGNKKISTRLKVSHIAYNDSREISELEIVDGKNNVRFTYGSVKKITSETQKNNNTNAVKPTVDIKPGIKQAQTDLKNLARTKNIPPNVISELIKNNYKKASSNELTLEELSELVVCVAGM